MATNARATPDHLLEISDRDHRYELVNGEIIKMPPPNYLHGDVVARTTYRLSEYAHQSRAGAVVVGSGCILELPQDPDRVRGPDVAFVSGHGSRGESSRRNTCAALLTWRSR